MISFCAWQFFFPIYISTEVIFPFGFRPFDICYDNPILWNYIKISFIFFYIFSNFIIINSIISRFKIFEKVISFDVQNFTDNDQKNICSLQLLIGKDISSNKKIYIPESGLYQNFLITGTIGTGKTSSAMYPFTEQLIKYNSLHPNNKLGILILDVKGNYFKQIKDFAKKYNLEKDVLEISLNSKIRYNPLYKPNLNPLILANRLKTILLLFSENNSESFWLDKAEQILTESIKLCRLYNNGYITFIELHKLITEPNYYKSKIEILKNYIKTKFPNFGILYGSNVKKENIKDSNIKYYIDAIISYLKEHNLIHKFPIVIITGDDTEETIQKAFNYPILDVLNKPFNENNIERVLSKIQGFYDNKN